MIQAIWIISEARYRHSQVPHDHGDAAVAGKNLFDSTQFLKKRITRVMMTTYYLDQQRAEKTTDFSIILESRIETSYDKSTTVSLIS